MQAEDKEPATPPKKTSRRRFLKILAGTACAVGIGKGIDLLLPLTLCRPGEWSGPITDHFNGRHFFTPARYGKHNTHKSASVFRWLFRKRVKGHYPEVTTNRYTPELATTVDGRDWEITMVNHATMLIRVGGLNILTDPIWSDYTSPVQGVGPKRKRPVGIAWNDLPKIDVCLLSHDHYDHFDAATLTRLYRRDNPLFIVPLGLRSLLNYHTGGTPRCEEKDWWDSIAVTPQVTITLTPALHWSRRYRHAEDSNRSLWCGFHIRVAHGPSVFFAGDTALSDCYHDIYQRLGSPTVALLPIGAYRPDWIRAHHTSPADAVQLFLRLHAQQAIACHFGTWQLADDGYQEALDDLAQALQHASIPAQQFIAPDNGQTLRGTC